jgi:hypothetical protein
VHKSWLILISVGLGVKHRVLVGKIKRSKHLGVQISSNSCGAIIKWARFFRKPEVHVKLKVINMEYKVPLFSIAWTRQLLWDVAAYACFLWAESFLLSVPTNETLPIKNHYKIFWRRDVIASAICRAIFYWNAARRSRESVSSLYWPPVYPAIDITAPYAKTLFYQLW